MPSKSRSKRASSPARSTPLRSSSSTSTSAATTPAPASSQKATQSPSFSTPSRPSRPVASSVGGGGAGAGGASIGNAQEIAAKVWQSYWDKTDNRTKSLDAFMGFLVVIGAVQFLYVAIGGNYPFNAFLSGFSAAVGQFVLAASLRIQTNPENQKEFRSVSHERAFADFLFGSLLLHFFCVNFIN